jgi:hypothetical protein
MVTRSPESEGPSPHRFDPPELELPGFAETALRAACEAVMCDEDDQGELLPPGVEVLDRSMAWVKGALAATTSGLPRAFTLLVLALELLPVFVIGRFSRMSRLPIAERIAYLEALETHRVGWLSLLFTAIKVPITIPCFEFGDELRETGYDRPSLSSRRV